MALNGSFSRDLDNNTGLKLKVIWSAAQDTLNNTSTIYMDTYLTGTKGWDLYVGAKSDNYCTFGDTPVYFYSNAISQGSGSAWSILLGSTQADVKHNDDGSLSINIGSNYHIQFTRVSTGIYYNWISASETITLDTIPRNPVPEVSYMKIGYNPIIKWTPVFEYYKYKISITGDNYDSGLSEVINPQSLSEQTYTGKQIPYSIANSLGAYSTGIDLSVNLYIYDSYGNYIATTNTTYFAELIEDEYTKPAMNNFTIQGINIFENYFLKGISKANLYSDIKCRYNSTISSITISINDQIISYKKDTTTPIFQNIGWNDIVVSFIDTRGFSNVYRTKIYVNDYELPKLENITTRRWNQETEQYDDNQSTIKLEFDTKYSIVSGLNSASVDFYYHKKGESVYIKYGVVNSGDVIENISPDYTYEVLYVITDLVGNSTPVTDIVSTSFTLMNFSKNSISFGKASEEENTFDCALIAKFQNGLVAKDAEDSNYTDVISTLKDFNEKIELVKQFFFAKKSTGSATALSELVEPGVYYIDTSFEDHINETLIVYSIGPNKFDINSSWSYIQQICIPEFFETTKIWFRYGTTGDHPGTVSFYGWHAITLS